MDSKFLQSRSIVYCMVCNYYSLQGKFCDQHQVEFSSLTMFDTAFAKDKFTTAKVTKMVTTAAAKERTNFEIFGWISCDQKFTRICHDGTLASYLFM